MSHRLFALLLGLVLAMACSDANKSGSSGAIDEPLLDVTGTWTGTFASANVMGDSGTIVIVLRQNSLDQAEVVSTTLTAGSLTCLPTPTPPPVAVDDLDVGALKVTGPLIYLDLTPGFVNDIEVIVDLDVLELQMMGTYTIARHPDLTTPCLGDVGTITATRPSP